MSKIPQGEWSAIAARYAQGESISAIARTYRCTPPAIHYILKRNERLPVKKVDEAPAEPVVARSGEPQRAVPAPSQLLNGEISLSLSQARDRPNEPAAGQGREPALPANGPARSEQRPAPELQRHPGTSRITGRASASNDGLDNELHDRAEAAIETFRSCFDAALVEGSPQERARLRQAASDLMRVAARTTIVLDRLSALGERATPSFDARDPTATDRPEQPWALSVGARRLR
jgi:hypothetical protein